jgi:hypothetical protein
VEDVAHGEAELTTSTPTSAVRSESSSTSRRDVRKDH